MTHVEIFFFRKMWEHERQRGGNLSAVSIPSTTTSVELATQLGMTQVKVKRLVRKHGIPYFTKDGYYVLGENALDQLVAAMLKPAPVRKATAKIETAAATAATKRNNAVKSRTETRERKKNQVPKKPAA